MGKKELRYYSSSSVVTVDGDWYEKTAEKNPSADETDILVMAEEDVNASGLSIVKGMAGYGRLEFSIEGLRKLQALAWRVMDSHPAAAPEIKVRFTEGMEINDDPFEIVINGDIWGNCLSEQEAESVLSALEGGMSLAEKAMESTEPAYRVVNTTSDGEGLRLSVSGKFASRVKAEEYAREQIAEDFGYGSFKELEESGTECGEGGTAVKNRYYVTADNLCGHTEIYEVVRFDGDEDTEPSGMTKERAVELLNCFIDRISAAENTPTTIRELLGIGFTAEELEKEFHFSAQDIRYAEQEAD